MARYSAPCISCKEILPLPGQVTGKPYRCTHCGEHLVVVSAMGKLRVYKADAPATRPRNSRPNRNLWRYAFYGAALYIAWPWLSAMGLQLHTWAVDQGYVSADTDIFDSAETQQRKAALNKVYKQLGVKP